MYILTMRPPQYVGVFSHQDAQQPETGKGLYFVWQKDDGSYIAQQVDGTFRPRGPVREVSAPELKRDYKPQPHMQAAPMTTLDFAALERLPGQRKAVSSADEAITGLDTALFIPSNDPLAEQVESTLRESFRKALLRLKRPAERQTAIATLERLAAVTENITTVHKHMFRDFGVKLRQSGLPELALLFGKRVLALAPDDDHAHFNLARILCALGAYDEAGSHIRMAMGMDKHQPLYNTMLEYINREKKLNRYGKPGSPGRA